MPAKLPTKTKKMRGTLRKCRVNALEPRPPEGLPECPAWLGAEARAEWARLTPQLIDSGVATGFDLMPLSIYCHLWGEFVEATKKGIPIPAAQLKELRLIGGTLGLTPVDRSRVERIEVKMEPEHDPWAVFD